MENILTVIWISLVFAPLTGIMFYISQLSDIQDNAASKWMLNRWMRPEFGPIELRWMAKLFAFFILGIWIVISAGILFSK